MTATTRLLWVCAVLAALCFVGLAVLSKLLLEPEGMLIFDSRLFGYTQPEAQAYLEALANITQGRSTYLGVFRQLDTVFPILLTLSFCGALWLCTARRNIALRVGALIIPVTYLMLDMAENVYVAQMLRSDWPVPVELVERASVMTQLKWVFLALSLIMPLVLWRRNKRVAA